MSVEDRGVNVLDDLPLSEQTFAPQDLAGLRYSTLMSGEMNRDGEKHVHFTLACSLYIYIELFTCSLYICNLNAVFPPRCQNNRPASQGAEQRGGFPANVTTNTAKTSKLQSACTMFNVHLLFQLLLEKQSLLNPLGRVFGIRKQFRKRAGNSECFWKYCV